ncbi:MAG: Rid family detoxifying hydrolase [bacterium]
MTRKVVQTDNAPAAIGPYSQAIIHGDLLFAAGQIPLDPESGQLVEGSIETQAKRVIDNLKAVLEAAGSGLDQVLRLDVFLVDLANFPEVNEYLSSVFQEDPPARVTVEVSGLPMGAMIEMAAIAGVKSG